MSRSTALRRTSIVAASAAGVLAIAGAGPAAATGAAAAAGAPRVAAPHCVTPPNTGLPTVGPGSHGTAVAAAQRALAETKTLSPADIDGVYGAKTLERVQAFQHDAGLPADGVVGPRTWAALPPGTAEPVVGPGSHGSGAACLQFALQRWSAGGHGVSPGPVDGVFGPQSEASLRAFQQYASLTPDGVAGDLTWGAPVGAAGLTLDDLAGYS